MKEIDFKDLHRHIASLASKIDFEEFVKQELEAQEREYFRQRFDEQKTPKGDKWQSNAAVTKYGGKFSVDYNVRPSGKKVAPTSKRWLDTSATRNSIKTKIEKVRNAVSLIIYSSSKIFEYMLPSGNTVFENSKDKIKEYAQKLAKYLQGTIRE
jgi:hypothetical protein